VHGLRQYAQGKETRRIVGLANGGTQQIGRDEEDLQETQLAFLSIGQGRQYSRPERTEVESVAAIKCNPQRPGKEICPGRFFCTWVGTRYSMLDLESRTSVDLQELPGPNFRPHVSASHLNEMMDG